MRLTLISCFLSLDCGRRMWGILLGLQVFLQVFQKISRHELSNMENDYYKRLEQLILKELDERLNRTGDIAKRLARQMINLGINQENVDSYIRACQAFGRFEPGFLKLIYSEITKLPGLSDTVKIESDEGRDVSSSLDINASFLKTDPARKLQVKVESSEKGSSYTADFKSKNLSSTLVNSHKRVRNKYDHESTGLSLKAQERLAEIRRNRGIVKSEPEMLEKQPATKRSRSPFIDSKKTKVGYDKFDEDGGPQFNNRTLNLTSNTKVDQNNSDNIDHVEDIDSQYALDRDWYNQDESSYAVGEENHNPFFGGASIDEEAEAEMELKMKNRVSAITAQKQKDSEIWEKNRMTSSGLLYHGDIQEDFDDDEKRIHLFVYNLTPPFLEGQPIFSRQKDPISAVRDPQGDLATLARKGSQAVQERRHRKEREKQALAAASLAGTVLGNVMGINEDNENDIKLLTRNKKFTDTFKNDTDRTGFISEKTLKEQRQFLPVFAVREQLLSVISDNQVIIVIGETGSGKTTQLTQYLFEEGYGKKGLIGCTQPRRVAAMSVAKRVSEEMEVQLGQQVGYTIRFEDCTSSSTLIKYMTYGILLRESLTDPDLSKYSCIIMDEAHERTVNTDVLLGQFKSILSRRRDLKLIVTSATMNADRFSQFYGGAPQFAIPGRTFPVDILHHSVPVNDYVAAAAKQVISIHLQSGPGDILVFMTGQEDVESTCEIVEEKLKLLDNPEPLEILPIYSQLPADLQAKIFQPAPKGSRKVVVATNIAETSLTVDGICFVVDCGFSKLKVYNPKMGMDTLQIMPISRANASQRSGRAGRTSKGVAYRLYTERAELEEMYPQTIPEIQRTNLVNTLLLLKSLGVDNLFDFNFLDPPPTETITVSLYNLWSLGALDNLGRLTPLGKRMSSFPMDPSLAKLIIKSVEYGCSKEMLTIVSMLSVPSVFNRPKERQAEADSAREKFFVSESDHLTLLHVYNQWQANRYSEVWCNRHFLHSKSLRKAQEVKEQLQYILENHKMEIKSCGGDWDVIRKCICSGYFHQAARVRGLGEYMNLRTNVTMQLHPTSALYGQGYLPDYVIYHELVLTSKQFMSTVTAVDPYWLADLGGVFYSVKEKGYGSREKQTAEIGFSRRMQIEASIEKDKRDQEKSRQAQEERARLKRNKKSSVVQSGKFSKRALSRRGI